MQAETLLEYSKEDEAIVSIKNLIQGASDRARPEAYLRLYALLTKQARVQRVMKREEKAMQLYGEAEQICESILQECQVVTNSKMSM